MRLLLLICLGLTSMAHARGNAAAPDAIRPLLIGQSMPDVTVKDVDGKPVQLKAILAEQPSVVVFLRGGWCYFCNRQLQQMRLIQTPLAQSGYRVVVISGDPPGRLKSGLAMQTGDKQAIVLSDPTGDAARALGLAYDALAKHFGATASFEKWQALHGKIKPWLPVPAVFLVHRSGLIVYEYINVDFTVRLSGEVLLTAAQAYAEPK
jgi:peroxiredoxin